MYKKKKKKKVCKYSWMGCIKTKDNQSFTKMEKL